MIFASHEVLNQAEEGKEAGGEEEGKGPCPQRGHGERSMSTYLFRHDCSIVWAVLNRLRRQGLGSSRCQVDGIFDCGLSETSEEGAASPKGY